VADWDERYRKGEHSPIEPHQLLVRALHSLAPGKALDVACGAGRHAIHLATAGWSVTAVDSSRVGIEVARQRAAARGVTIETVKADLERGEFTIQLEAFDLICIFYYLQRDLFSRLKAGVRPGGTMVAAIHMVHDDPQARQMNPDFLLDPGELRSTFSDWNIDYYHEGHWDNSDHKHRDAEIIARKPVPPG
jgi:tellurite methyltransferase